MNSSERITQSPMGKNNPKLTALQDKRQIALDWFTDPEGTDIGKFCVHVKHAPQARRFVRLAAEKLDLISLRKMRNENPDIDETVKESIMGFTIPNSEGNKTKLTLQDKRQIALDWFTDPEGTDIGKFCVHVKHAPQARRFVRLAAEKLDLISLRKMRNENPDIDETVKESIMGFTIPNSEGNKTKLTLQDKRQIALDWFTDPEGTDIGKFCVHVKHAPQARRFVRLAAEKLDLISLRKMRNENPDIDETVKESIMGFTIPNSEGNKTKLTLQDKRQIALDWFTDPEGTDIGKFCVHVKHAPQARRFVRLAAEKLDLISLRKMRNENPDIDETVKESIMGFTIPGNESNKKKPVVPDVDSMKKVLIDFFEDESMNRALPFIRKNSAFRKYEIHAFLCFVKKMKLRHLRKLRDELGIRSKVMAAVDKHVNVGSIANELQSMKPRDKSKTKEQVPVMEPTQMKEILIEWFDHDNLPPIPRFLRPKGLLKHRLAMTNVISTLKLHELRNVREEPGMREKVLDKIDNFFLKNPNLSRASDNGGRPFNRRESAFLNNPIAVQTLLKQWYDDEQMLSIVAFLQKIGKPEIRRCVAHLVNEAHGLRKLRKHRENPGFRERAMKVIDVIVSKKTTQVAPNLVRNTGGNTIEIIPSVRKDMVKKVILEWFEDKQMRPINTILRQHGHKEVTASVIALIKSNRLRELRNKCDEPKSKELARRKIESIFTPCVALKQKKGSGQSIMTAGNQQTKDELRNNAIENMDVEIIDEEATMESLVKPFGASFLADDGENYVVVDSPKDKESSEDGFMILS